MPGLNGLFISKRARAIHKFVKANRMCKGAGTSGFCPKLILLLLALLPQFVHPEGAWSVALQIMVLVPAKLHAAKGYD